MDSVQQDLHDSLKLGKGFIADEKNWIKGFNAKNADGIVVDAQDDDAVCFCSVGAVLKTSERLYWPMYRTLLTVCRDIDPTTINVSQFNDSHTHAEVMQMWDIAIQTTQPKENHG